MPYTRSRYTKEMNVELEGRTFVALIESGEPMTIEEIKNSDICLRNITGQKIARILSKMVEMGFATKFKGSDGRMIYQSTSVGGITDEN